MAIATGLAIALAASAGAQAVGGAVKAKKQSTAAKKAAEQQVQGTKEATGYQREGLGQLGQLYSPYINAGASAANTRARLTTPGPLARYASPGPPNAMPQPTSPYGENPDAYGAGRYAQPRPQMSGMGGGYGPGGASPQNFRARSPFQSGGYGQMPPPEDGSQENPYMMAKGGTVTVNKPTHFVAGEAGPERVNVKPMKPVPAAVARPVAARPAAVPRPAPAPPGRAVAAGRPVAAAVGSVRANAARAQEQQLQMRQREQAIQQQQQAAGGVAPPQDPRSAEEFLAHQAAGQAAGQDMSWMNQQRMGAIGGMGGNTGIAGGNEPMQMVPEMYGAMGPNAGGPWGNMIQAGAQAGAQMGSAMGQPMGEWQPGVHPWAQGQRITPENMDQLPQAGGLGGPMAQALPQRRALQMKQALMQAKPAPQPQRRGNPMGRAMGAMFGR